MWAEEHEKRVRADLAAAREFAREQGREPKTVVLSHADATAALDEIERLKTEHASANTRLGILGAAAANLCAMATDQQGFWTIALTRHVDALRATLASTAESRPVLTEEQADAMILAEMGRAWIGANPVVSAVMRGMILRAARGDTGESSATAVVSPGPVAP